MWCQELDIHICIYTYHPLDNRYGFSISFQLKIPLFVSFQYKKNGFQNFQQLAGLWLVGEVVSHLGFMDLRRPSVARRSNVSLVCCWHCSQACLWLRDEYYWHRLSAWIPLLWFQPCCTNLPTVKYPFDIGWFCSTASIYGWLSLTNHRNKNLCLTTAN